jgi:hypothetical protein
VVGQLHPGGSGLYGHHADAVRDHVVQLPRDPAALGGGGGLGALLVVPLELGGVRFGGRGAPAAARQEQGEQPRHGAEQSTVDRLPEPNPYVHDGNDRNRAQPNSQTGYRQLTLVPLPNGPEGEQQRDRPSVQAANSLWVGERKSDLHAESERGREKREAAAQQQGKRVEQNPWNQQPPGAGDLAEHQLDLRQHGDRNDQSVEPAFRNNMSW